MDFEADALLHDFLQFLVHLVVRQNQLLTKIFQLSNSRSQILEGQGKKEREEEETNEGRRERKERVEGKRGGKKGKRGEKEGKKGSRRERRGRKEMNEGKK